MANTTLIKVKLNNKCSNTTKGTSLVVQWLRLQASKVGGHDLIPSQGTRILYVTHSMAKNFYFYFFDFWKIPLKWKLLISLNYENQEHKNQTNGLFNDDSLLNIIKWWGFLESHGLLLNIHYSIVQMNSYH